MSGVRFVLFLCVEQEWLRAPKCRMESWGALDNSVDLWLLGANNVRMSPTEAGQPRPTPNLEIGILAGLILLSGFGPADRLTWFLETVPLMIAIPWLWFSASRFPLTPLLRTLIVVHACVLALGGAYTYAEVPLGAWLEESLQLERNPYDRIGHFVQGFVPAILTREVLMRRTLLVRGAWLSFLCVSVCLAFSAFYELIEWWAALTSGEAAEAFLGTQGDVWDTQWDMCLALIGAVTSLALLTGLHDRHLVGLALEPQECPAD